MRILQISVGASRSIGGISVGRGGGVDLAQGLEVRGLGLNEHRIVCEDDQGSLEDFSHFFIFKV